MKKYKVTFATDYFEWSKTDGQFKEWAKQKPEEVLLCEKWQDKEITLLDLEDLIEEFGSIVFDGCDIMIYNNWIE